MDLPPVTHLVYIPAAMLIGMVIGFVLGRNSVESDQERRRLFDEDLDDF